METQERCSPFLMAFFYLPEEASKLCSYSWASVLQAQSAAQSRVEYSAAASHGSDYCKSKGYRQRD